MNNVKKYKKIYALSEKSYPKSVPGLKNMPKKYQTGKSTRNI